MTKNEKSLLLKDLCSRLPYGVYVYANGIGCYKLSSIELYKGNVIIEINEEKLPYRLYEIKPYLRPMTSMTEEEKIELNNILEYQYYSDDSCMCESSDWLNERHFDYRGLIPKGLAIAVTKNNNPYKKC